MSEPHYYSETNPYKGCGKCGYGPGAFVHNTYEVERFLREGYPKYCCDKMMSQFNSLPCEVHGNECPDYVVQEDQTTNNWYLTAGNADYAFKYCPWCAKPIPEERIP